jgi:hypothetical protein
LCHAGISGDTANGKPNAILVSLWKALNSEQQLAKTEEDKIMQVIPTTPPSVEAEDLMDCDIPHSWLLL